ncbi:hypothetical protein E2R51_08895 [Jeotgalibacillus sp. S-D1]|uniref:competence protein ComK n=1 Tax=Jeotgalibacillus sp. S-D1 TaxID=2552189 RepID=UPI00105AABD9|nr:competence protein ComK [Jeotgalibacillus sp. S-D1]TDL32780.1 hypothetical protein E2R51_08895 [Jeotgalibacillus sp. S-D1]
MTYLPNNDYRINSTTLAMQQAFHLTYQTVIYDVKGTYYSQKTMTELLEEACLRGGSKMSGRLEAAKHTLAIRNKIPLIIDPFTYLYAFPTHSPKHDLNSWIFLDHISEIKPHPDHSKKSIITFRNEQYITASCSFSTATTQKARTTQLCYEYTVSPIRYLDRPLDPFPI